MKNAKEFGTFAKSSDTEKSFKYNYVWFRSRFFWKAYKNVAILRIKICDTIQNWLHIFWTRVESVKIWKTVIKLTIPISQTDACKVSKSSSHFYIQSSILESFLLRAQKSQ